MLQGAPTELPSDRKAGLSAIFKWAESKSDPPLALLVANKRFGSFINSDSSKAAIEALAAEGDPLALLGTVGVVDDGNSKQVLEARAKLKSVLARGDAIAAFADFQFPDYTKTPDPETAMKALRDQAQKSQVVAATLGFGASTAPAGSPQRQMFVEVLTAVHEAPAKVLESVSQGLLRTTDYNQDPAALASLASIEPEAKTAARQMLEALIAAEPKIELDRHGIDQQGAAMTRWNLARMLEAGEGGPKDTQRAIDLYQQAVRIDYAATSVVTKDASAALARLGAPVPPQPAPRP